MSRATSARPPHLRAKIAALVAPFLPFVVEWAGAGLFDDLFFPDPLEILLTAAAVAIALVAGWALTRTLRRASAAALALTSFAAVFSETAIGVMALTRGSNLGSRLPAYGLALIAATLTAWLAWRVAGRLFGGAGLAWTAVVTLVVAGTAAATLTPNALTTPSERSHPDVLLVVMDTARADHLSAYGYGRATTPGLGHLAATSRVYEGAMSPASWTSPSHASIFTGLLPAVHGTDGDFQVFDPPGSPLAEILQKAGYRTAGIVNNPNLHPSFGWARGFDSYAPTWTMPRRSMALALNLLDHLDEDWPWLGSTRRSFRMARRWWSAHDSSPRFLFLNLIDPHSPYGEAHRFRDLFLDDETRQAPDISNDSEDYDAGLTLAAGPALRRVVARYDGDLRYMDAEMDSFIRWLDDRGDLDRTVIVLCSDHGERLGERGLLGHQLGLDLVLLHVPLIVRYPPRVTASRVAGLVQIDGIFATIFDLLDLRVPDDHLPRAAALDDQDLQVTVAQMRYQGDYLRSVRARNPSFDARPYQGDWNAAFDGRWQLWSSTSGVQLLFDLAADPAEERDVAKREPEVVEHLSRILEALPRFGRGREAETEDRELLDRLRSLGYVR